MCNHEEMLLSATGGKETVESRDHPHTEGIRHIEENKIKMLKIFLLLSLMNRYEL